MYNLPTEASKGVDAGRGEKLEPIMQSTIAAWSLHSLALLPVLSFSFAWALTELETQISQWGLGLTLGGL